MKNGKIIFIATLLLVSLLCISAVSAADDAASDVIADNTDETVLEEGIDDADLQASENDENVLNDDEGEWSQPSPDPPVFGDFVILNKTINNGKDVVYLDATSYEYFEGDEGSEELKYGIVIDRPVTIYGNGHTINGRNLARIFWVQSPNVVFHDINFINGNSGGLGGAICGFDGSECTAINCTFTNNYAENNGGAISEVSAINCTFKDNQANGGGGAIWRGTATNCNFLSNHAKAGGAIYEGTAINCNFTENTAEYSGGAICWSTATNCNFNENSAGQDGGAMIDGDAINCNFNGNSADYGGAMYDGAATNCNFTNNHANYYGGAFHVGTATNCNFIENTAEQAGAFGEGTATNCYFKGNNAYTKGGAISFGTAINCNFSENHGYYGGALHKSEALNSTFTSNYGDYGGALYESNAVNSIFTENFGVGNCWGGAIYNGSAVNCTFTSNNAQYRGGAIYIGSAVNCIFNGNTANYGGAICGDMDTGEPSTADSCIFNGDTCHLVNLYQPVLNAFNFISTYGDGQKLVVNFTSNGGMPIANANIKVDVYTTAREFIGTYNILSGGWNLPFNAGNYIAVYNATDFDIDTVEGIIVINKAKSTISSKAVSVVYNNNKYLTITLKDAYGKAIKNAKVTVTLASAKAYYTDKNGQIKINVGKLVPKTYTAKISFAGNANILASSTTAKVTVKKATPKLTAKAKTFKAKVKTKKYVVTLKTNKGKVMKKVKLTLKVGKKTYKATTNAKGKATFKITKLAKKGKYTATIKFAGSKYYNKLTKKVKITVKK